MTKLLIDHLRPGSATVPVTLDHVPTAGVREVRALRMSSPMRIPMSAFCPCVSVENSCCATTRWRPT